MEAAMYTRIELKIGLFLVLTHLCSFAQAAPLRFGEAQRWLDLPASSVGGDQARMLFGRVDRNASADLVIYNYAKGQAYVALSNGRTFGTPRLAASGLPQGIDNQVELADVNGDGLDDLVIFSRGPAGVAGAATAVVALSNGSTFDAPRVWNSSWCANVQTCLVGDINGDHRADIVAITQGFGTVFTSLSQGSSFGPNAIWNNYFCVRGEKCALGDVDGDGKADAILFKPHATGNQKGNVLIARSTGSAFTDVRYGHGFFCIDNEQCLVGDVNGDHRADIVLTKGWGIPGWTQLEVLVSLSDGTHFINANPFTWAHIPYLYATFFGTIALADVTGDGRADLLQFAITGNRYLINVYPVTDVQPASPAPSKPAVPGGFRSVHIYNCHPDQHRLYFWNFDRTTGSSNTIGPIDAMYSESGFCPDPEDTPQVMALADGHVHTILAIDPDAIGCEGRNDPSVVACVNNGGNFSGSATGPDCHWIVSAQAVSCGGGGLGTMSVPLSAHSSDVLISLRQAGVDYSVSETQIRDWLGNRATPYPAVADALLKLLKAKPLRKPVYLDVVVWNYTHANGGSGDDAITSGINVDTLKKAVMAANHSRYGGEASTFESLLR